LPKYVVLLVILVINIKTAMKTQDFFARTPVFTHDEFVQFLDAQRQRSPATKESLLAYFIRKGRVLRVRRGLYCVVPYGFDPVNCPLDPYLLAAKMTDDAVLAYHTALEFYGRAYSVHERFLYLTSHASRQAIFRSYHFRPVLFPRVLCEKRQETFGVNESERAGVTVRVTSLERTLVDVLARPSLGGGWEEVWRSLESVEFFDLGKVIEYVLLLENSTTAAKVGFFLEQHGKSLMVEESHLGLLREHRPKNPHYVTRKRNAPGRFVAGWNLVVPVDVIERPWQELA
jgi:predicted transcriptional regulator of viral defense system